MLPSFLRNILPGGADDNADQDPSAPRRLLLRPTPSEDQLPPPPAEPLPPYLTSRPLLFLTLLSPPILALLLALFTLTLLATQATGLVAAAKREILAGCTAAERASRVLDHVPALMREQSEKAIKKAVEGGVSGVGIVLMLACVWPLPLFSSCRRTLTLPPFHPLPNSITIIQEVLKFLIDTFRSTYMCCLELVIFGALAILIGAIEEVCRPSRATLPLLAPCLTSSFFASVDLGRSLCDARRDPKPHPIRGDNRQLGRPDGCRRHQQGHLGLCASPSPLARPIAICRC